MTPEGLRGFSTVLHYSKPAVKHLRAADPVMRKLIGRVGPFELQPKPNRFKMLAASIISQQISTAAARTIRGRLEALIAPRRFTAENVALLKREQLRSAGLSGQKAEYLHALAAAISEKTLRLDRAARMPDEELIEHLTAVKGIGVWTAQMFLMFSLGRPDVFPHGDLGIRSAIKNLYGLKELPDRQTSHTIAEPWRPYATVASWYCWRSLDLAKQDAAGR
jgi:DNA-3-methyladenine glycosylase II